MVNLEKVLKKISEFPTLPTVYTSLLNVMSDSKSTAEDIAGVISKDQASASKVLKVVNSSIFGLQNRINSIAQAVVYIGYTEIKNIVIALSIMDTFAGIKSNNIINPANLWKHSLAVGVETRLLGKTIGVQQFENYFLAGILHDLGKLALQYSFPEEYTRAYYYSLERRIPLYYAEKEIIGCTSAVAGNMLAEKWKLPLYIINTIKRHRYGKNGGEFDLLLGCVHVADIMATASGYCLGENELIPQPNPEVWDKLNLPENFFRDNSQRYRIDVEHVIGLMLNY